MNGDRTRSASRISAELADARKEAWSDLRSRSVSLQAEIGKHIRGVEGDLAKAEARLAEAERLLQDSAWALQNILNGLLTDPKMEMSEIWEVAAMKARKANEDARALLEAKQ